MLKILAIAVSLMATPLLAVELRDATNQQILDELSRRLNNGGGGNDTFTASARCNHADLEVSIYNEDFQVVAFLDEYYGSTTGCQDMISALPFGANGRVRAGQQLAYCDHADLMVYGVLSNGALRELSDTYKGSRDACWTAMREFNQNSRRG